MKNVIREVKKWVHTLTADGAEIPDPTPIAVPLRLTRPPSRIEDMRMLMSMVERENLTRGRETLEESDDFNVGDDYDPRSPWEIPVDSEFTPLLLDPDPAPKEPGPQGDGAAGPIETATE